jgi:hypothetical protein
MPEMITPPATTKVMNTFVRPVAVSRSQANRSRDGGRVSRKISAICGSKRSVCSMRARRRSTRPVARPISAMTTMSPKKSARFHSHRFSDTIM